VESARLRVERRVSRVSEVGGSGAGRLRAPGEDSKGSASSMEGDSTRRQPVGRTSTKSLEVLVRSMWIALSSA
jgi:hypothetical protein